MIARGRIGEISEGTFSASVGSTAEAAGAGVRNGQVRLSAAGEIRAAGGTMEHAPEPAYPGGPMNYSHVHVAGGRETFGEPAKNTSAKRVRPPSAPEKVSSRRKTN